MKTATKNKTAIEKPAYSGKGVNVLFGLTLREVLDVQGKPFSEISRATGVNKQQLTRWKAGEWDYILADKLSNVIKLATSVPAVQDRLVAAYLNDVCPRDWKGRLKVVPVEVGADCIDEQDVRDSALRRKLLAIAKAANHPDISRVIDSLSAWAIKLSQTAETPAKSKKAQPAKRR